MLKIINKGVKLNPRNVIALVREYRTVMDIPPMKTKTLKERLEDENQVDLSLHFKVDIGLPPPPTKRGLRGREKVKLLNINKQNVELEKQAKALTLEVDLDEVSRDWYKANGPSDVYKIAEHYGIYNDLFQDAYFIPYVYLEIGFPQPDEMEAPVFRGNVVKPAEAKVQPNVRYESNSDTLWTLVLTNPDGHLTQENMEYVHWFVGNIPGNDISKGEVIWDYLQPFPPRGIGFQRFIFILYKQDKKIDYSSIKGKIPRLELKDRTFSTLEFYRERQDFLTPAGLAFFQSDWDLSVIDTYHKTLNMDEPIFEYDHDVPYMKPQEWFPKKRAFNLYLDKYRDPRDIAKEYLLKKTENLNPFETPKKPFPYPNVYPIDHTVPTWLKTRIRRDRTGCGRIADQKDEEYE